MPQFRYRAVTHAGEIVVGEVDASSREEVVRRIEYLGHLTIDAEIAATGILDRGRRRIGKLPRSRDVSIFLRQLSLLIGAGLTLEAALQTLGDDASKGLAVFANGLRASISAGESFAEALERHSSIIDPTYVAMVRVGEASGKLEAVLRAIVEDRTRRELMADRINSAIRYPLFLIGTAAVILLFFLIYVVPQFEPVFKDLLLWGVDELLTYHYLVAEVYRIVPANAKKGALSYDDFWKMSKTQQADHIWKHLFVERTPISEACRGVLTSLEMLGLEAGL